MGEGKCYLGSLLIEELIAHDMCWAISLFEDVTSGRFFMFHAPMDGPTAMPIWIALTGLSRFIRDGGGAWVWNGTETGCGDMGEIGMEETGIDLIIFPCIIILSRIKTIKKLGSSLL